MTRATILLVFALVTACGAPAHGGELGQTIDRCEAHCAQFGRDWMLWGAFTDNVECECWVNPKHKRPVVRRPRCADAHEAETRCTP